MRSRRRMAVLVVLVILVGAALAACGGGPATVDVRLNEWSVAADPGEVAAGEVTFVAENIGAEVHELVVIRAEDAGDLPTREDGSVDEAAIAEEDFIGEIEEFPSGETREGTFELTAGNYALICNVVETEGGAVEAHYERGMATNFTVTE